MHFMFRPVRLSLKFAPSGTQSETSVIDEGCGAANIYHFVKDGKDILIAANREINEVAMYTISG